MTISLGSPHGLAPERITWGRGSTATNTTLTSAVGSFPGNINGYTVTGTGVAAGSYVVSGQGTSSLTLSAATTATADGINFVFTAPTTQVAFPKPYPGSLDSNSFADHITSAVNEGATAIEFGTFAAEGTSSDKCKAVSSASDILAGIAVRQFKQATTTANTASYAQYDTVPLAVQAPGLIWVEAAENVYKDDVCVAIVSGGGTIGGRSPLNVNAAGTTSVTAGGSNTGNGTLVMDATTPLLTGYQDGTYTATVTTASTNSGTFTVTDPSGNNIGTVSFSGSGASGTFATQIKFAVTDAGTDFIVGDKFTIVVNSGRIAADGKNGKIKAKWYDTTASGQRGRVLVEAL